METDKSIFLEGTSYTFNDGEVKYLSHRTSEAYQLKLIAIWKIQKLKENANR